MKFQVTVTLTYEADPENYPGADTPEAMAKIDESNYQEDPYDLTLLFDQEDLKVTITPVKE